MISTEALVVSLVIVCGMRTRYKLENIRILRKRHIPGVTYGSLLRVVGGTRPVSGVISRISLNLHEASDKYSTMVNRAGVGLRNYSGGKC